jgi:hypothetical protein
MPDPLAKGKARQWIDSVASSVLGSHQLMVGLSAANHMGTMTSVVS